MAKEIPKYTGEDRTRDYLIKLVRWIGGDERNFPQNQRGDVVLILKSRRFFTPRVDETYQNQRGIIIGGHVKLDYFKKCSHLDLTSALVLGNSGIDYYSPWEEDLRLLCEDGIERCQKAVDDSGFWFLFLPHPSLTEYFSGKIKYLPGLRASSEKRKANLIRKFREYVGNIG